MVYSPDDRRQVTNTTQWPYRAIAMLWLYDSEGYLHATCTGTFIGPNVVATAAHCLMDKNTSVWAASVAVVPGENGSQMPFGYEWASWEHVSPGWAGGIRWNFEEDYGLLVLPDSYLGNTVGWIPLARYWYDYNLLDSHPTIAGYPGDKPDGTLWEGQEPGLDSKDVFMLYYHVSSYPGESGAAVRRGYDGKVMGIHNGSINNQNQGRRIEAEVLDDWESFCYEYRCVFYWWSDMGGDHTGGATETATPLPPTVTPTRTMTRTPTPTWTRTPTPTALPERRPAQLPERRRPQLPERQSLLLP